MKIKLTIDGTTAFKATIRPEAFTDAMVDIAPHMAKVVEAYAKMMADTAPAFAAMVEALEAAAEEITDDELVETAAQAHVANTPKAVSTPPCPACGNPFVIAQSGIGQSELDCPSCSWNSGQHLCEYIGCRHIVDYADERFCFDHEPPITIVHTCALQGCPEPPAWALPKAVKA